MKITKTGIVKNPITKKLFLENVKTTVAKLALTCESNAKSIISSHSVDTGRLLNSVHSTVFEKPGELGFSMLDGVSYGIYHEFGSAKHWVPFFWYGDTSKPILAGFGKRVLKLDTETMLAMGGIMVEIKKTEPFMRALLLTQDKAPEDFKKANTKFTKQLK